MYRFSVFNKNMRAERFLSFSPIEINISRFYSFAERCGNIFFYVGRFVQVEVLMANFQGKWSDFSSIGLFFLKFYISLPPITD